MFCCSSMFTSPHSTFYPASPSEPNRRPLQPKHSEIYPENNLPSTPDIDYTTNYIDAYRNVLMGQSTGKALLDKWVNIFLNIAAGDIGTFAGDVKIDEMINCIGYDNSVALMIRCYQLASEKLRLDPTEERVIAKQTFGKAIGELSLKYPKEYKSVDFRHLPFKKENVSVEFILELNRVEREAIRKQEWISRIAVGLITFVGLYLTASWMTSQPETSNDHPVVPVPDLDSNPDPEHKWFSFDYEIPLLTLISLLAGRYLPSTWKTAKTPKRPRDRTLSPHIARTRGPITNGAPRLWRTWFQRAQDLPPDYNEIMTISQATLILPTLEGGGSTLFVHPDHDDPILVTGQDLNLSNNRGAMSRSNSFVDVRELSPEDADLVGTLAGGRYVRIDHADNDTP